MDNFRFTKWKVYIDSKDLVKEVLKNYNTFPFVIKRSLGEQLLRSVISIPLNIAEGSGKNSDKELNRFINISIGSAYETFANLDILRDNEFINEKEFLEIYNKIDNIVKQLGGFKKKLR
jgi:four helix bundle protein